jgi:hypothetical protein
LGIHPDGYVVGVTLVRRDIPALPDLVFATAAEASRLAEWLPEPYEVVGQNDDLLILRSNGTLFQVRVTADLEQLTLRWEALAHDCTGTLRVDPLGAGNSVAQLDTDRADPERLLEALAKEVERAFPRP